MVLNPLFQVPSPHRQALHQAKNGHSGSNLARHLGHCVFFEASIRSELELVSECVLCSARGNDERSGNIRQTV
jgi:hypothetical protein